MEVRRGGGGRKVSGVKYWPGGSGQARRGALQRLSLRLPRMSGTVSLVCNVHIKDAAEATGIIWKRP
jgi:hypothetical protein